MDSEIKESSEVCESGESKGKDALETKWKDYFMTEALKSAEKSEDPKTQVMNRILWYHFSKIYTV